MEVAVDAELVSEAVAIELISNARPWRSKVAQGSESMIQISMRLSKWSDESQVSSRRCCRHMRFKSA